MLHHLEDHLSETEEPLAQRAAVRLDLADPTALQIDLLQRPGRPLEVGSEDDEVVDLGDAVGMRVCGSRFNGDGVDGQAVDVGARGAREQPPEQPLPGSELEPNGFDRRSRPRYAEPGAPPAPGIGADRQLSDSRLDGMGP